MYGYYVLYSVSKERERVGRDLKYHSPFAKRGERQTLFDILVNFRCTSSLGVPSLFWLLSRSVQSRTKEVLKSCYWEYHDLYRSTFLKVCLFSGSKKGIVSSNFWKGFSVFLAGKSLQARKLVEKSITKEGSYAITIRQSRQYGDQCFFLPSLCDHFLVSSSATARLMCFFFFGQPAFPLYLQRFQ